MANRPITTSVVLALALVAGACGDDTAASTSSDAGVATSEVTPTSAFDGTTVAPGPTANGQALVVEGDVNETARAFQWLLNCTGYGPLTVDGAFGPASKAAVELAQADLNREVTGAPDSDTLALLSRACGATRPFAVDDHDFGSLRVIGNVAPDDVEVLSLRVAEGDQLLITPRSGAGFAVDVLNSAGLAVGIKNGDGSWETIFTAGGDYLVRVSAATTTMFEIEFQFSKSDAPADDVVDALVLAHRGLIAGGTEYYFGDDPDEVVAAVTAAIGAPIDDSGWVTDHVEGGLARAVNWGALWLSFSDAGANGSFGSYYFGGTPVPDGVAIVLPGITLGSTVTEVLAVIGMYREDVGLDQWEWVQGLILEKWVLQTGNGEFGYLCFDTGLDEQPSGEAIVRSVSAGVDCTVDGE
jgi:hypothetical protein